MQTWKNTITFAREQWTDYLICLKTELEAGLCSLRGGKWERKCMKHSVINMNMYPLHTEHCRMYEAVAMFATHFQCTY
jgi:hypothetical protein